MALFEEEALDPRQVVNDSGSAHLWRLADTVYVTRVSGSMTDEHADLFVSYGELMVAHSGGSIQVFHDWLDMTGYTSASRKRLTEWSLAHLGEYQQVHISLRSKLVGMGVQVANIALRGQIQVHHSRATLEAKLRDALANAPGSVLASSERGLGVRGPGSAR
jgi:hypothetical protein